MPDLTPQADLERRVLAHVDEEGHVHTRWVVVGPGHAISFKVRTGGGRRGNRDDLAWGIDHHMVEEYPEAWSGSDGPNDCDLLPGGKCYLDGSALQALELWKEVLNGAGEQRIWTVIEDRYARWAEGQEDPAPTASTRKQHSPEEGTR